MQRDRPVRTGFVISVLKRYESQFREYKRKRMAYVFRKFRREPETTEELRCKPGSPSYYFVSSRTESVNGRFCGALCGRAVVCHPTGEKVIHPIKEFFEKYEVSGTTSTAYPRRETVSAVFPTNELLRELGGFTSFINFWGRLDEISLDTVVIMYAPGKYYVKDAKSFRQMYTAETRDRSKGNVSSEAEEFYSEEPTENDQ